MARTTVRLSGTWRPIAIRLLAAGLGLATVSCGGIDRTGRPEATSPLNNPILEDLLLQIRPGANVQDILADYNLGEGQALPDGSTYRVTVGSGTTESLLKLMQTDNRIETAEENLPVKSPVLRQTSIAFDEGFLSTDEFFQETQLSHTLNLPTAHTRSKGLGIKVAILDTGVNAEHKVLQGRISPDSHDFIDDDSLPQDLPDGIDNDLDGQLDEATGHGTHVAGLVATVAPASRILALRVLNSDGQGTAFDVAAAVEYAVDHGARVINLSLSLSSTSSAIDRAFEYARSHGVILVTAAGNSGNIEYPAYDTRVWAVAALGVNGYPASFTSSFVGVVISAPGENILSTNWDGGYSTWSGTSMAAPIVSATAALVLAVNPGFGPAEVRTRLEATARLIPGAPVTMGAGRIDPVAAVGLLSPVPLLQLEIARGF